MKTKIYLMVLTVLLSIQIGEAQQITYGEINEDYVVLNKPEKGWGKMVANDNETYSFSESKHVIGADIYAIAFTDAKNGWAIGMMEACSINCGVIFHTNDGGQNWYLQFKSGTNLKLNSIEFSDPENGWVNGIRTVGNSCFDTLLITNDGGKTWIEGAANPTGNDLGG